MPEHQQSSKKTAARVIGYILRAAVAFLCSFGVSRFISDSLGTPLPNTAVLGICFAFSVLLSVMLTGKIAFGAGAVVAVAGFAYCFESFGGFFTAARLIGLSAYNVWCVRLEALGYRGMGDEVIDISDELLIVGRTEQEAFLLASTLVIFLCTAICALSTVRRARVTPILCLYIPIVGALFYFEAAERLLGLGLMLAAICAVATISAYDTVFCKRKNIAAALDTSDTSPNFRREVRYTRRTNANLGGYAGVLSALIALLILAPALSVNKPMPDIPQISHPAAKVQSYLSTLMEDSGGGSVLFDSGAHSDRSTEAKDRSTTGQHIFEVQTDVKMPVYLRSWVGSDYYDDSWHTASESEIEEYREMFGTGFSHEFLTSELLRALDPALTDKVLSAAAAEFGYITAYVHIDKKSPTSSLVYMPSYTDQRVRLLQYGTTDKAENVSYQNYYDGIFTSQQYIFTDKYSVLARLSLTPSEASAKNIGRLITYYAEQYELLREMRQLISGGADMGQVREKYPEIVEALAPSAIATASRKYVFPTDEKSLAYRYAYEMDASERRHIDALTDNLTLYYNYVYDNYLTGCEFFTSFQSLMGEICAENGIDIRRDAATYEGRHRICDAVIDYLSENMTYTLSPKSPSGMYNFPNGAATFLFDTKEGYCSQYASAAVMLLRSAGIPARYAEGYIANNFAAVLQDGTNPGIYSATVRDEHAHAWIEVYYDYYGWVVYEATAPYVVRDTPASGNHDGIDTAEPEDTTVDTPDSGTTEPIQTSDTTAPITDNVDSPITPQKPDEKEFTALAQVVASVFALCVLASVIIILKHRSTASKKAFAKLIETAKSELVDAASRIAAARALSERIMRLLASEKLSPMCGEQASEFGERAAAALGDRANVRFVDVVSAIGTAEFAEDISNEEISLLCTAAENLRDIAAERGNPVRRWLYKYFGVIS